MLVDEVLARCLVALLVWPLAAAAQPARGSALDPYSGPYTLRVDAPPALAGVAARVEAIDPASLARPLASAGLQLPPHLHVILVADGHEVANRTPSWIAGQAFGTDTMVIYPQRIGSYPYDSLESVVLHEAVHLALTLRAGQGSLPRWFHEGVAVSVESGWGVGSQVRLLWAAAHDPRMDDVALLFESGAVPETTTAYLLSAALVEDIRRRHGLTVPGTIAARVAGGESFERAFAIETGETVNQAAAQAWRVYRGVRWLPIVTSPSGVWGVILGLAAVAFVVRLRRRWQRRREWDEDDLPEEARESKEIM
ncbi:MAG TPA: hypothetical protein VMO26_03530 [Vicinamibacterales bacterium]|nr:hypothetical protein [Vicinamibacterales bacterium]